MGLILSIFVNQNGNILFNQEELSIWDMSALGSVCPSSQMPHHCLASYVWLPPCSRNSEGLFLNLPSDGCWMFSFRVSHWWCMQPSEEPVKAATLVLFSVFVNKLGPFTERLRVFPEVSNGTWCLEKDSKLCSAQQGPQPQMPGLPEARVMVLTLTVTAQMRACELKASLKESPFREHVSVYIAFSLQLTGQVSTNLPSFLFKPW